jgi:RNA polymerase-binding transcription factor DksA
MTVEDDMPKMMDAPAYTGVALTSAQRRELEAELRQELARLERAMAARRASGTTLRDDEYDPQSAHAAGSGGPATLLAERAAAHHLAVVSALDRLALGTYGICVDCQEPIPYGRLLAMPETAYCMSCGGRG